MNIIWTPEAERDRADILDFIADDNLKAAARMDELFGIAAARLGKHPHLGRPGLIHGTRELIPHENYRMVYEIRDEVVWILSLVHTSRQWPPVQE